MNGARTLISCLLAFALLSACGPKTRKGDGVRAEFTQRIVPFAEVEVHGAIQAHFDLDADAPRVQDLSVSGDRDLLETVDIHLQQDLLRLSSNVDEDLSPTLGLFVEGRPRTLRRLLINERAQIRVRGQGAPQLIIEAQDESRFTVLGLLNEELYIQADDKVRGGLQGESQSLTIVASRQARVDARNLRVANATIQARDGALVRVCATDSLHATVSGRARIIYTCNPQNLRIDESDSGRVRSLNEVDLERKERARRERDAKRKETREKREKRERLRLKRENQRLKDAAEAE